MPQVIGALGGPLGLLPAAGLNAVGIPMSGGLIGDLLGIGPKEKAQDRQASITTVQIGERPRMALFGTVATAGTVMDVWNSGGDDGTDWETVRLAIADHECEELVGLYVNDAYVAFGEDGVVPGYRDQLEVFWLPGTEAQSVPATILASNPDYDANDNGAGVAQAFVRYMADDPKRLEEEELDPVWTGRPTFLFVVKGKKCYQARKDSSVGGSGAHRWANPSTWEWTDNAADCRYNWVRGVYACDRVSEPDQLLVGRGLSAEEAPPENVFAWANICDETVALAAGGAEKRYTAGAVIAADETYINTENAWAAAMGGVIIQIEGSVEVEPGYAKTPVISITDDDLVVGTEVRFSNFRSKADDEWVNTIVPRYVEPDQKWVDHAAPLRRQEADVAADGGSREQNLTLSFVTSGTQAQRCGEIRRRMGRLTRTATITLGPVHAGIEEGDWITWTSARRTGGLPVVFRVDTYMLNEKWQNTLTLREMSAVVYDWDTSDEIADQSVAEQQAPRVRVAPAADDFELAAELLSGDGSSIPALVFAGAVGARHVEQVRFEYYQGSAAPSSVADWIGTDIAGASVTRREVTSISAGTAYMGAISYRTHGLFGPRRVLGPVSTDTATTGGGRWKTASGGRWKTVSGGQWLLEA
jgi:hypothetical protein